MLERLSGERGEAAGRVARQADHHRLEDEKLFYWEESSVESPVEGMKDQLIDLLGELRQLKKQIEENDALTTRSLLASSPFNQEILAFQAHKDFKVPNHSSYDETVNPCDHLLSYQAKMLVVGAADQLMCKAFFPTLKGFAQQWFMSLPPGSIHSFVELAEHFLTHFAV